MATKKRKSTKRRTAARRKKAEQRLPAGLGTLFGGLLLMVLAFVQGDSVWRVLHDVLFGLFGCGSFVLGAAVCCLAVLYTRGEELLSRILKLVLGGGHSIGIPLAVSAQRSFIVPTATMTVHPVRHSGVILGVPQTMHWFDQMQQRITGFVAAHSGMTEKRYTELMLHTGELVMDMGTVLDGRRAVKEKLIDELGGLSDALDWLHRAIETRE